MIRQSVRTGRTFSTSSIQREVIQAQGHSGSNQNCTSSISACSVTTAPTAAAAPLFPCRPAVRLAGSAARRPHAMPLAPETVRQLRDALHRYKVIFFRDQHLDHASQIAFGRQFGTLTYAHPHDEAPPDGYADVVPDIGGDTQWTSLQAAYEGLSPAVRAFADGLRAEHRAPCTG
jgi:hypothetical protein